MQLKPFAMKRLICILCLTLVRPALFSQGVLEKLFYLLPPEFCMDYDADMRKLAMDEMKEGHKNSDQYSMYIDEKAGYLQYDAFQCSYQMCYWNINEKEGAISRIVAVREPSCVGRMHFLKVDGNKLIHYHDEVFESFNAFFFFKDDIKLGEVKDRAHNYYFSLPRKGVNITVNYGSMFGGYEEDDKKKLLKGDKIDFVWDNGYFKMGEPYF